MLLKKISKYVVVVMVAVLAVQIFNALYTRPSAQAGQQTLGVATTDGYKEWALTSEWTGLRQILTSESNTVWGYNVALLTVQNNDFTLESGTLVLKGSGQSIVNGQTIILDKAVVLVSANKGSATVIEGAIEIGELIVTGGMRFANGLVGYFDRGEYKDSDLALQLTAQGLVLQRLTDFSGPKINLFETNGGVVDKPEFVIKGTSEEGALLSIDGKEVTLSVGGGFEKVVALKEGVNTVVIQAKDALENTSVETVLITYDPCSKGGCTVQPVTNQPYQAPEFVPPVSVSGQPTQIPPVEAQTTMRSDSTVACENEGYNYQFLQILNVYRNANGLNSLTINPAMNLAACDHAKWMSETDIFSHTGVLGSTPTQRCQNRGVYCDAENLVMSYPDNSPQHMFDLYKASPGHNANMLGDHSSVGIAWSTVFQATEFR